MCNQLNSTINEIISFLLEEDLCVNTNLYVNDKCYYYDAELLEYTIIHEVDTPKRYKDISSKSIVIIELGELLYFAVNGYADYSNILDRFNNFLYNKGLTYSIYNIFCIELMPLNN